jgi:hypothetical protein
MKDQYWCFLLGAAAAEVVPVALVEAAVVLVGRLWNALLPRIQETM